MTLRSSISAGEADTPAREFMSTVTAAAEKWRNAQGEAFTFEDLGHMLKASWEVMSEIPGIADAPLEEGVTDITRNLCVMMDLAIEMAEEERTNG